MKITKDYVSAKLEIADQTEKHFSKWLEERGWNDVHITEGKFSEYDIIANKDGFEMKWEIKTAAQSEKYGSYFIETFQSGLPSGLQLTTADYYVFYDETGDVTYISVDDLKEHIEKSNLPLRQTGYTSYGGKVSANGYVVKKSVFHKISDLRHSIEL